MPRGTPLTPDRIFVFLERVAAGDTLSKAAEQAGQKDSRTFLSRADRKSAIYDPAFAAAFAEAIDQGALAKADSVDEKFEVWIEDPDRSDSLRLAWAKRHHPAYRERQQLEVSGGMEVTNPDVAAAIERFTERVVSLAAGRGADESLALPVGDGEGRPDVPVASLERTPEPGGTAG